MLLVQIGVGLGVIVGYLSTADKLQGLHDKWSDAIRRNTIATLLSVPPARQFIVNRYLDSGFPAVLCDPSALNADLDRDGSSTDLLVTLKPADGEDCAEDNQLVGLLILQNRGWDWTILDILDSQIDQVSFRTENGYVFHEVHGTDFPFAFVYAAESGRIRMIYSDFMELPSDLATLFSAADRYELELFGRRKAVRIFPNDKGKFVVQDITPVSQEWSRIHILSPAEDGGYALDGVKFDGTTTSHGSPVDIYRIPPHCVADGMIETSPESNTYVIDPRSTEIKICCPDDPEEFGVCDQVVDLGSP